MKSTRKFIGIAVIAAIALSFALAGCSAPEPEPVPDPGITGIDGNGNPTPTASDFTVSGSSHIYDGSQKTVTISPKQGKSQGQITIYYNGSTTAPSAAGTYTVTFDVAATTGWNEAKGLSAGTLTITQQSDNTQTPTAADFTIGNLTQTAGSVTAVTITPKQGKSEGQITIYYNGSTAIPQTAGTYTVTFDVAAAVGWNAVTGLSAGTLTVSGGSASASPIISASIDIAAPAKDAVPATTASASGAVNFTIGTVTWSPADNPFQGGKAYTAAVTLTAASGHTFTGLTTAAINGQTATVSNNTGSTVRLSYAFPATENKTVYSISIETLPTKVSYSHNDKLNLDGLIIKTIYTDSSNEFIRHADFASRNITTSPDNGGALSVAENNGKPVTVTFGGKEAKTVNLTVNPIAPVLTDFAISGLTQNFDGNPKSVTVTAREGITGMGTVTVKHNGLATVLLDGTYPVTFDVAAGINYTEASGFSAGTLTVALPPFTSVDVLAIWLSAKPANTAAAAYNVVLNVDSSAGIGTALKNNNTKYVKLDLSGSTFKTLYGIIDCTGLTSLTIGNSVTKIEDYAISGCTSLTGVTIPDSVNIIGEAAFAKCTSLASITIPSSVTRIGISAFYECTGLTSVTIPNSVTSIPDTAFYGCNKLASLTIPNGVTSIGQYAFQSCNSLTSLTIPSSVTSIGQGAFIYCTGLTRITIPFVGNTLNGTSNTHFGYIFGSEATNSSTTPQDIPASLKTVIITGGDSIPDNAFRGCTKITGVTIPNTVTRIGERAFYDCTNLTSVTIPNSVTNIGNIAFNNCTSLTSVTIPNSVTGIGSSAFNGCTALTSVRFERADTYFYAGPSGSSFINQANSTSLKNAYSSGRIGTYTRPNTSSTTWTKKSS